MQPEISRFDQCRLLVVGDLMIDEYVWGEVLGRKIVENYGGRIELVPITEEISTSQIIDNIKNT